ncbi:MAG: type III pantothenate kinase [Desulfohalobiaceae bacterium]|nr:type III pantothenate kinase [Desulfohalobiaceae bacterium]
MNGEQELILLMDVGNTNIKIGLAGGNRIVHSFVLPTTLQETSDTLGLKIVDLCSYLQLKAGDIRAWMVSSVVPPLDELIRRSGETYSRCPVLFVPEDVPLPLTNYYTRPQEVGADRLVTAYAARELFDTPGLMVVDFGTATTVECVQDRGYLGGLICPGVLSALNALGGKTAKLPRISLELDSEEIRIGASTAQSLTQGFVFGFASMIEGLCQKLRNNLQGEVTVVATGGFARKIQPVCPSLQEVREDLLLKGLLLAHGL